MNPSIPKAFLRLYNTTGAILRRLNEPCSGDLLRALQDGGGQTLPLKALLGLSAPVEVASAAREAILKEANALSVPANWSWMEEQKFQARTATDPEQLPLEEYREYCLMEARRNKFVRETLAEKMEFN